MLPISIAHIEVKDFYAMSNSSFFENMHTSLFIRKASFSIVLSSVKSSNICRYIHRDFYEKQSQLDLNYKRNSNIIIFYVYFLNHKIYLLFLCLKIPCCVWILAFKLTVTRFTCERVPIVNLRHRAL